MDVSDQRHRVGNGGRRLFLAFELFTVSTGDERRSRPGQGSLGSLRHLAVGIAVRPRRRRDAGAVVDARRRRVVLAFFVAAALSRPAGRLGLAADQRRIRVTRR